MKTFLLGMFVVTIGVTGWLAYQNRAHKKVLNLYSAALIGGVGALVTLLFSLDAKSQRVEFPCSPIYHKRTKQAFLPSMDSFVRVYTARPFDSFILNEALKTYPDAASSDDPEQGDRLYLDITFRNVVDTLCLTFASTWDPRVTRFDLPTGSYRTSGPEGPLPPGVRETRADISALLPDVRTLDLGPPGFDFFTLPPNSRLAAEMTDRSRTLKIANPFAEVSINVAWRGGIIGVGVFKPMCNLTDEESNEFWSPNYVISCEASFSRFRSGHPDMPRYHTWVDTMMNELQATLDSERLWKEAQAIYQLGLGRSKVQ